MNKEVEVNTHVVQVAEGQRKIGFDLVDGIFQQTYFMHPGMKTTPEDQQFQAEALLEAIKAQHG